MDDLLASLRFRQAVKRSIRYAFAPAVDPEHLAPRTYTVAQRPATVVTVLDGQTETRNTARPGDFVVCGPDGERYVLTPSKVIANYNLTDTVLVPRRQPRMVAQVTAAAFSKFGLPRSGAALVAPWGEQMLVQPGDFVVRERKGQYYRIARSAFAKTYVLV